MTTEYNLNGEWVTESVYSEYKLTKMTKDEYPDNYSYIRLDGRLADKEGNVWCPALEEWEPLEKSVMVKCPLCDSLFGLEKKEKLPCWHYGLCDCPKEYVVISCPHCSQEIFKF